ncbi:MAG: hypothetical protein CXT77_04685 [uncultured DHVE6 group euryarchaeote]|nr:MAG: hypothetical protein CXT77_04685 [uncultured DHVE6 group euryarchaeote]
MDEYQLRREALFDAEVSAVQNGNTNEFYRINAEISALDDKFRNVQEIKETSRFRKFGNYILGGLAVTGLALTGAAKDMAGSSLEDSVDSLFAGSNDAQMASDFDANQTTTNGDYVISLEDNRLINIVDVESGSETQIGGDHYQVGSMTMEGDVLQYTTMSLQGNDGIYRLNEFDMNTGQTAVLKEETSAAEPDFYVNHDTDGVNNVYVDNDAVVVNGETVYTIGNNSMPNIEGDSIAFASEQTENNETTQNVVTIANGEINTIYSGNQSVEFVEFLDGNVVYGLENLLDNKTVDLHIGDSVREVPNGMFDADNGNLTWIEQTEDGFSINLYNFETDQTENIYVSTAEMRNPQISGDLVTWEQKHGLSDSFKAWYSNVTDLITEEQVIPTPTPTPTPIEPTETEENGYSGLITVGVSAALIGLIYLRSQKKVNFSLDEEE